MIASPDQHARYLTAAEFRMGCAVSQAPPYAYVSAHPGARAPAELVLTRVQLPLHPVRMRLLGAVAYVGIDHFDALTSGRLLRAVASTQGRPRP